MKKQIFPLLLFLFLSFSSRADTIRALFLGNSYTAAHNLPELIARIAHSCGDSLYYQSNTPGGYTFQGHSTNAQSIGLIQQGNWDFLILQEQSQLPSFPDQQVQTECFPFARYLDSLFNVFNPCGETVFYRTWGRKNGDSQNCPTWPPVCTYEGMDSILNRNYRIMADSNDALICPAGSVWRYIREHNPPTFELYDSDGSHPSAIGAMATALSFYTVLFRKSPALNTYPYVLTQPDLQACVDGAVAVAWDSLSFWNVGKYDPFADFSSEENPAFTIHFTNLSENSDAWLWDFGDGQSSIEQHPVHTYDFMGWYTVTLSAFHCDRLDTVIKQVWAGAFSIDENSAPPLSIWPNPAQDYLMIKNIPLPAYPVYAEIYDVRGQLVKPAQRIVSTTEKLDLTALMPGSYFLKIDQLHIHFMKQSHGN